MRGDNEGHGIILDDKGQEQPRDKDRAQTAPGHMPSQPEKQEKPVPKT